MPRDQADASYLWDMLTAAQAVADFTNGRTFADDSKDLIMRSAVERQIEIIGEAPRRVSEGFRVHPKSHGPRSWGSAMCWPMITERLIMIASGRSPIFMSRR
jgi:uncharacterized protein with HEPN domain